MNSFSQRHIALTFLVVGLAGFTGRAQPQPAPPNLTALGPKIGVVAPSFSGNDQFGRTQTLQTVLGPEGAMLVFFRSADW